MTLTTDMSLQARLLATEQVMAKFHMRFPRDNEMAHLHNTFQPMIAAPITSDAQVAAIQAQTGQCVFVHQDGGGNLTGSMLLIQLSKPGLARLIFQGGLGTDIDADWICTPQDTPSALLVWGLLGRNAWFAGRVLAFSLALAREVYADIPILTYAATPDGARIMERVGFRPSNISGLYQLDLSIRKGGSHDET